MTLRHDTAVLFDTYLGKRTGRKVLGGLTQRGDGEDIRSAILFCDLRDSTSMAGSMSRERYLHLLNEFFEHVTEPILARGGEVLKFIGEPHRVCRRPFGLSHATIASSLICA